MAKFQLLVVILPLLSLVKATSFYDNPEQDTIPLGTSSLEELERKWGLEVFLVNPFQCLGAYELRVLLVGLLWNIHLRSSATRQMLNQSGRTI